jgi:hypothetical protein
LRKISGKSSLEDLLEKIASLVDDRGFIITIIRKDGRL